jgi:Tol biopolymer transport system component
MTERSAFGYTAFWLLLGLLIASLLSGCMVFQVQSVIPPAIITSVPTSVQTLQPLQRTPTPSPPLKTPTPTVTATPTLMTTLMPAEGLIAFNLSGSDQEGIYVVDVQLKNHRAVITGNEIYSNPVWTQDGKTIYFLSDLRSVSGILKVFSIGIDGSDLKRLTIDKFYDSNLALSPDGRRLAYISGRPNGDSIQRDIYELFTQNGAELPQLTNDPLYETTLSWSPDGKMIAYIVQREGTLKFGDLYVMAADGSDKLRLTKGLVLLDTPSWSPDGSKLVVAMERNGNQDLYLINVDGSGITRLTATDIREARPVWSPNSQMIIYEAIDENGVRNIFRINSYGGGVLQLTDEQQHAEDVAYQSIWSPNGDHIAYVTQSSYGQAELYIMNVDGTGKTKLVGNLGQTIDGLEWVIPLTP